MSIQNQTAVDQSTSGHPRLLFPFLAQFYTRGEPITYALLRIAFGLSILTHGIPKLLGMPHGSMADPMAGTTNLIGNVLGLPFAPQLAIFVALLETFGAIALDRPRYRISDHAGVRVAPVRHSWRRQIFRR